MNTDKGLTLIEVLVAVAILAAAMMSVFSITTRCLLEIRRTKHRTLATQYAQMMIEMIASSPHNIVQYHGLGTANDPPLDNPVRDDVLHWKAVVETFPVPATGSIRVVEGGHARTVTVNLAYEDSDSTTTATLVLKLPRPPGWASPPSP